MAQNDDDLLLTLRSAICNQNPDELQNDLKEIRILVMNYDELRNPKIVSEYVTPLYFAIANAVFFEKLKLLVEDLKLNLLAPEIIKNSRIKRREKPFGVPVPPPKELYLPPYWKIAMNRGLTGDPTSTKIANFVLDNIFGTIKELSTRKSDPNSLGLEFPEYKKILLELQDPNYLKQLAEVYQKDKDELRKLDLYYMALQNIDKPESLQHLEALLKFCEEKKYDFEKYINKAQIARLNPKYLLDGTDAYKEMSLSLVNPFHLEPLNLFDVAIVKGNDKLVEFLFKNGAKPSESFSKDPAKPTIVEKCFMDRFKKEPNNVALQNINKFISDNKQRLQYRSAGWYGPGNTGF